MIRLLQTLSQDRLVGLIFKETLQTLRDRHLLFLLVFPPTIQLLLLGAALDPGVHEIELGIIDQCRSSVSRSLISTITKDNFFRIKLRTDSVPDLEEQLDNGEIKAAMIIPARFGEDLLTSHVAGLQVLIDGTDAYTARIAQRDMLLALQQFNGGKSSRPALVTPRFETLYNPELRSAWYFIPGVMGAMLTLTSTLVSSAVLLREKEHGTLEQLLMSPYSVFDILLAKVTPIFVLLMGDAYLAVAVGMIAFSVPFRGSLLLFSLAAALYVFVGMGLGIMLATLCKTERQAHLVSFFVNIPIMQLSGAVVPFETMPQILQSLGAVNPLRYFTLIARNLMLKGADLRTLWPSLVILAVSAFLLFSISLVRFRKQLH